MGRCARTDVEFKLNKKPFELRFGMFEVVDERFDKEAKKSFFHNSHRSFGHGDRAVVKINNEIKF